MFMVYDANGAVFGNPKGYKTYRGASWICSVQRRKLWAIHEAKPAPKSNLIFSIKWVDTCKN